MYVDFPRSRDNQVVSDDDSGGGLFGTDSELIYRAPHTGEYFIAVTDATGERVGGYYLSATRQREGAETVIVPPSPQLVDSSFGTMLVFEDEQRYFSVQTPEAWIEGELDESLGQIFYAFDPRRTAILLIGGRKVDQARFYREHVRRADAVYDRYLLQLRREGLLEPEKRGQGR